MSVLRPKLRRMSDETGSRRIGGEPRELLLQAITCLRVTKGPGGWGILSGQLPQDLAQPFTRALMRIEAELLLDDADTLMTTSGEPRTQSERRADALVAMVLRLAS